MTDFLEERQAINRLHDEWLKYFHKGDGKGIASLYTEDLISLPPGTEAIKGRKGIVEVFTKMFEAAGGKGLDTDFTIDSFDVVGDYVYITGEYKLFSKDEKKCVDYSKHVVIFKKVKGKWFYHRDLWCDNGPLPAEN